MVIGDFGKADDTCHVVYIFGSFRPGTRGIRAHDDATAFFLFDHYNTTTTSHAVAGCDVERCCVMTAIEMKDNILEAVESLGRLPLGYWHCKCAYYTHTQLRLFNG